MILVHPDEAWKKAEAGTMALIQVEALDLGAEVADEGWGHLASMSGLELPSWSPKFVTWRQLNRQVNCREQYSSF